MSYSVQSLVEQYQRFKLAQSKRRKPSQLFRQFCEGNNLSPTQIKRLRSRLDNSGRM